MVRAAALDVDSIGHAEFPLRHFPGKIPGDRHSAGALQPAETLDVPYLAFARVEVLLLPGLVPWSDRYLDRRVLIRGLGPLRGVPFVYNLELVPLVPELVEHSVPVGPVPVPDPYHDVRVRVLSDDFLHKG